MRPHCVAEKSAMLRFRLRRKPRPVEEKKAPGRAPVRQPSPRQGPAYRCLLRFCLAFGHAIPFWDSRDCRPVADGAGLVGVSVSSTFFSFRCRWLSGVEAAVQWADEGSGPYGNMEGYWSACDTSPRDRPGSA